LGNSTAQDLRSFLDHPPVTVLCCEQEDPALGLDIDRPKDYHRALKMFFDCITPSFPRRMKRRKS
jgi:CTP:molybdopterin cytidylyltransferase MocA